MDTAIYDSHQLEMRADPGERKDGKFPRRLVSDA